VPLLRPFAAYAPCVVLIDELVAYIRQFPENQTLTGGSYDSNLSFVQTLTEAAKLVPTAIVLASLPESDVGAGSQRGVAALRALEKTFGRVQALWKPVATEEAFEIVRRRLFEPVRDAAGRDAICRTFADAYVPRVPNYRPKPRRGVITRRSCRRIRFTRKFSTGFMKTGQRSMAFSARAGPARTHGLQFVPDTQVTLWGRTGFRVVPGPAYRDRSTPDHNP